MLNSYRQRSKLIKRVIFWAILIGGLFALFFVQTIVNADTVKPIDPCDTAATGLGGCVGGIQKFDNADTTTNNLTKLIIQIITFLIYIGAAIAVLFGVIGGYYMITSNGDEAKYKQGRDTLTYATIGLVVTLISATIISVVGNIVANLQL